MTTTTFFAKTVLAIAVVVGLATGPSIAAADVILDWNAIAVATLGGQNPFNQARLLAIVQLAVFDAVNAITGTYEPYLGTIVAPAGASADAAAVAAAHDVLRTYAPNTAWAALDAAQAASLAAIPDGAAKNDGIAAGRAAAAAMMLARANDGSAPPAFSVAGLPEPGVWQLTPSCPATATGGVFFHWSGVTPFGIESAADFIAGPPPALTSRRYAKAYEEVKRLGSLNSSDRPQDRSDVARVYAGSSPGYVLNLAARQVSIERDHSITENARTFALLNMAINDSFIATMSTKYVYNRWRPETAIHAGDVDGNPDTEADPDWQPFIVAPCFPSYTSNHAGGSYGGAEMLRRLFGAGGHSITIANPAFPGIEFHYTTFKEITADIDDARVYGGIHFRFDQQVGGRLGRDVADYVLQHNLRRLTGNSD